MSQTTVSGNHSNTITPGSGDYSNSLVFDSTAYVLPSTYGAKGVYGTSVGANLTLDDGAAVIGGWGNSSVAAGIGIDLTASATVTIDLFTGPSGYAGVVGGRNFSGAGGVGVSMTGGGHLYNNGNIFAGFSDNGIGAVGVIASGGTIVTNTQVIYGGFDRANNDVGGVGLQLTGNAQLSNSGRIEGGNGFSNYNVSGGTGVVATGAGVSATDSGGIYGGYGYGSGHAGVGVLLSNDATMEVTGSGNIHGGNNSFVGTRGTYSAGGQGGAAAAIYSGATLTVDSNGYIRGGQGATPGVGVYLDGGTLVNGGEITSGKDYSPGKYTYNDAVQFGPAASQMTINSGSNIDGNIGGFSVGDTIDATSWVQTGSKPITSSYYYLSTSDGSLKLTGLTVGDTISFTSDGNVGTDITVIAPGTVTSQVVIGSSNYPSPLLVGSGGSIGAVAPSDDAGTTAVISEVANPVLTVSANGAITGGAGSGVSVAGDGVSLGAGSSVTVKSGGTVTGGYGDQNVTGGVGVDITATGTGLSGLSNYGKISGGAGNAGGGGGVFFSSRPPPGSQPSEFYNSGNVYGGSAYVGPRSGFAPTGGYGASLASGTYLKNTGLIKGGAGGVYGGTGLILSQGATAIDEAGGSIIGGSAGNSGIGGVGVELVGGGVLTVYGKVSGGTGLGGTGDAVTFNYVSGAASNLEQLRIGSGANIVGDIAGFGQTGSYVDVLGWSQTGNSATFTSSTYTLDTPDGDLTFTGLTIGDHFAFGQFGVNGTAITEAAACYRRGTRIATERGEVAIESLRIGDQVLTQSGALRPIRWIGKRSYSRDVAAGNRDVLPVLFRTGSLGGGIPRRDLWVSPEHAMWIDGMLIPARTLVNGKSILQEERAQQVSYIHIEFDTHDVVLAEGAPSESYVDDESREQFDNLAEYCALYPDALRKPARFCAPRVDDGEALEAVRRRLLALSVEGPANHGHSEWRGLHGSRSGTGPGVTSLTG